MVPTHPLLAEAASWHSDLVSAVRNFAPFLRRRPEVIPDAIGQIGPVDEPGERAGKGSVRNYLERPTVLVRRPPRNIGCGLSDEDGRTADGDVGGDSPHSSWLNNGDFDDREREDRVWVPSSLSLSMLPPIDSCPFFPSPSINHFASDLSSDPENATMTDCGHLLLPRPT